MVAQYQDSGPRSPLTEDVRRVIIALLSNGSSRRMAARYVGVHPASLSRLMACELQFCEEVLRERDVEIEALRQIREAGKDPRYWRAGAWLLERRSPAGLRQTRCPKLFPQRGPGPADPLLRPRGCHPAPPAAGRVQSPHQVDQHLPARRPAQPVPHPTLVVQSGLVALGVGRMRKRLRGEACLAAERAEAQICNPAQAQPPAGPGENSPAKAARPRRPSGQRTERA